VRYVTHSVLIFTGVEHSGKFYSSETLTISRRKGDENKFMSKIGEGWDTLAIVRIPSNCLIQ